MIAVELVKQLRRLRTLIGFGALVAVPVIAGVANKLNPGETGDGEGPPFAVATTASGSSTSRRQVSRRTRCPDA